jgi:Na+-driven multidrug efflux pump
MSLFKKSPSPSSGEALFSNKALVKLIVPLFLQQVLSVMVGAVDTMMVSDAGEAAVSGVSLVSQLDTFLVIFFTAMVTGGSVVISQKLGEKNVNDICEAAKQLLYVSTALALILAVTVISLRGLLLNLLFGAAEADVMKSALDYFLFVAMSFPFLAISFSCGACFQAAGNSSIPLTVSIISNVVNITFNALFIYVFGLGAMGAAVATLISYLLVFLIRLIHARRFIPFRVPLIWLSLNFILLGTLGTVMTLAVSGWIWYSLALCFALALIDAPYLLRSVVQLLHQRRQKS